MRSLVIAPLVVTTVSKRSAPPPQAALTGQARRGFRSSTAQQIVSASVDAFLEFAGGVYALTFVRQTKAKMIWQTIMLGLLIFIRMSRFPSQSNSINTFSIIASDHVTLSVVPWPLEAASALV
jgi:hypothetical protein